MLADSVAEYRILPQKSESKAWLSRFLASGVAAEKADVISSLGPLYVDPTVSSLWEPFGSSLYPYVLKVYTDMPWAIGLISFIVLEKEQAIECRAICPSILEIF